MKRQRSVDYDGLDGILQLPDITEAKPKGYRSSWLYALIAAALLGAFLLRNQNKTASPPSFPIQTDSTVTSLASKPSPIQEPNGSASKNPQQDTDTPQTDSSPDHQDAIAATEPHPEQQAANLEPATASPKIEVPAVTPSGVLFTVRFKLDSNRLTLLGKSARDELIDAAKSCPNLIKLTGHTCNLGSAAGNRLLGLARANSVKKLLAANDIPAHRIAAVSEGMERPAATNDTPAGQAQNRRVELICQAH